MNTNLTQMIADCLLTAPDIALIVADRQRRIVSWGKGAELLYRLSPREAIGRYIEQVIHFPLAAPSIGRTAPELQPQASQWSEGVESGDAGYEVYLESFSGSLRDDNRELSGMLALIHDITNRKRAERQLVEMLAREQQSRAESQKANAAKDEFLAMVVHELRTPLNSILAWTHLFRRGFLDQSEVGEGMVSIEHSAKTLSKLVEDLLDVSRIVAGKLTLELREVAISTVIEIAAHAVRPVAEAGGVRLQLEIDPSVGTVIADARRLEQIVSNLLMNAIKFTPAGGRVQLTCEHIGGACRLTISDTGSGINPSLLQHVFEPFWQGENPGFRKSLGLGLGLTIVDRLVRMHGGHIVVESAGQDMGTKVSVDLPLQVPGERVAQPPDSPEPGRKPEVYSETSRLLADLTILVVDDDLDFRNMLNIALSHYGAEVRVARTVSEALEAIGRRKIDVIISDLDMPEEDGYVLIGRLGAMDLPIPVIALTGYSTAEASAVAAGYTLHLTKPVEIAALASAIAQVAGRIQ